MRLAGCALVSALLLAGCGLGNTEGAAFARVAPPPGKSVIYIYRPSAMPGSALPISLTLPSAPDECLALDNARFYAHVTDPGRMSVGASASGETQRLAVDLPPGDARWVRVEWMAWGSAQLTEVPPGEALAEIAATRRIVACPE